MKAIKIIAAADGIGGQKAELQDTPIPKLREGYVRCKVLCVGLNPTDWYVQLHSRSPRWISYADIGSGSISTAMEVSRDVWLGVICVRFSPPLLAIRQSASCLADGM